MIVIQQPHNVEYDLLDHNPTPDAAHSIVQINDGEDLVALPGLEPGLFALRGRRVNQLHHNAKTAHPQEDVLSSASSKYSKQCPRTQDSRDKVDASFERTFVVRQLPNPRRDAYH